jgi:hypothetical protein
MVEINGNATRRAVRQPRRRRNSYRLPIERRAAAAARMVEFWGWVPKEAAGAFCVNPVYLNVARQLSDDDRLKLDRGELKLSHLYKDYRQRLAERRAQRLAAEREAKVQTKLDRFIARYGADRIMAALDRVTAPQRQAAE